MTISKIGKPFTVEDARRSATVRCSDGTIEHYQTSEAAYLFAACDEIDALRARVAFLESVIETFRSTPGIPECLCCHKVGEALQALDEKEQGINVIADPSVPPDTAEFRQDGKLVGKIENLQHDKTGDDDEQDG